MRIKKFTIGRARFMSGRPLIVGILNVTPDSFSDGGRFLKKSKAAERALRMEEEGADILDIGGESSRPSSKPVTLKEELNRVIPVIEAISRKSSIPLSIDTTKPEVARAAVLSGAQMINSIGGFTDPEMADAACKLKKPLVVMHMRGTPQTMQKNPRYKNVTREVAGFLERQVTMLGNRGAGRIIVDPGIGFGKTAKHNMTLLRELKKIVALGYPVMVGASRKSFIGSIAGASLEKRLGGSIGAHLWAVMQGAELIRVHDVYEHRQALDTLRHLSACSPLKRE